jgi:hypothetical protein
MAVNKYVDLNAVKRIRPRFLYSPLLVEGVVNLVAGEGGVGKSTLVLDWVAKASRGLLEGDYKGRPCNILIYSQEDSASLLKSRLEAAGADLDRIIPIYKQDDESVEGVADPYTLPADKGLLEQALTDNSASVLVLDPITSLIAGDSNKRDDVRKSLDPLAALASRLDVTVIGLLHFNKGGGYASDKISGSHAFRDLCRSLILVAKDDGTQERAASIDKSNYSQAVGTSYSFTIADKDLPDDNGETEHIGVVSGWRKSDTSVAEIINRNHDMGGPEGNDCERDLIDYLEQQGGSATKQQVMSDLRPDWSTNQLQHAQQRCSRITSERSGFPPKATWTLTPMASTASMANINDSNGFELASTASTGMIQPTMANTQDRCNSNGFEHENPCFSHISQSSRGIGASQPFKAFDVGAFLSSLPEYANQAPWREYSDNQLHAIRERRSGLWHSKASGELARRAAESNAPAAGADQGESQHRV